MLFPRAGAGSACFCCHNHSPSVLRDQPGSEGVGEAESVLTNFSINQQGWAFKW